jgi:hypothetical protein
MVGLLNARLPELGLGEVRDERGRRGRRWALERLLRAPLVGMAAGCHSLAQTEALTAEMSRAMRRLLGLRRRVPDTTMRSALIATAPEQLRRCLRRQVHAAHRRKALRPQGLPFGVVAVDGKATRIAAWDEDYSQRQTNGTGGAWGIVRTMTCALVSSRPRVCLDASPVPSATNEMGHFPRVVDELMSAYGRQRLFRLVSTDSGSCSEANGRHVVAQGLDYLFRVKETQPTLLTEARALLSRRNNADAETVDIRGREEVRRRVYVTAEMSGFEWEHLRTVLRVETEKLDIETGEVLPLDEDEANRYYVSSLALLELTPLQWLTVVRAHWGVENNCHNTWDTAFAEDDHPWIVSSPRGTVSAMVLRRIAYNLLSLYRSVTQRSEEKRQTPWRTLLRWVYNAVVSAEPRHLAGLRLRPLMAEI